MSEPVPSESLERERQLAQLQQLRLQNEKMQIELTDLKKGKPWYFVMGQIVPMLTALVAIAGLWFGLLRYQEDQRKSLEEQKKSFDEQQKQAAREEESREREFMKPWLESQRDIYQQALSAAATVANSVNPETQKKAAEEFWRLYQGKMILVETTEVSTAMVVFGNCLTASGTKCDRKSMNDLLKALGTRMAESMAATTKMTYREFEAHQFKYGS